MQDIFTFSTSSSSSVIGYVGSSTTNLVPLWLDSKKPNSVVYACFGSMINFADCQLLEIAAGLEASGQDFIWVVKKQKKEIEKWFPEGFEKRMEGKGLIIRDWTPQVLILEHKASEASVKREAMEKAVTRIMEGDDAEKMRNRAKALGEMASRAVEEGGSSFSDLTSLIEELRTLNGFFFRTKWRERNVACSNPLLLTATKSSPPQVFKLLFGNYPSVGLLKNKK
ncbi:putative hexosyltransferase [Rosa chinensis]|uniref:Putative hexosyltransferase n=1 Tax=Rosa chinensis TaxID=74649 RepID=A0A2P6PKY8_ROSCH|nr:putative hexosyltransferase [Rosa chinensis]